MVEEFRVINDFPNYEVSNLGTLRNSKTGRVLRPSVGSGYYMVRLCVDGKGKTKHIHQLVGKAFILNPDDKPCVDHINGTRTDNNVANLRFATYKENGMNSSISAKNTSSVKGV
jgi:hypothetical protein